MSIPGAISLPALPPSTAGTPDLFFVISKAAFAAASVREVTYQLTNGGTQEVPLSEATYDSSNGVFYIPLSTLFGAGWTQVYEADVHNLVLDVDLENDQSFEFQTEFSMVGFPSGVLSAAASQSAATPAAFSAGISQGQAFLTETVTNPTGHAVALWMRVPAGSALTLQTRLSYSGWQAQTPGPDPTNSGCIPDPSYPSMTCHPLPDQWSTVSSATMPVTSVVVSGSQSMTLANLSDWTAIPLAPKASVTLGWQAVAIPGTPSCSGKAQGIQEVHWEEAIVCGWVPCQGQAPMTSAYYKPHDDLFPESWSTEGAELSGKWTRELKVAETDITADELENLDKQSPDIQARVVDLPAGLRNEEILVGLPPSGVTQPDACQGMF